MLSDHHDMQHTDKVLETGSILIDEMCILLELGAEA